jgi:hypothetical protein
MERQKHLTYQFDHDWHYLCNTSMVKLYCKYRSIHNGGHRVVSRQIWQWHVQNVPKPQKDPEFGPFPEYLESKIRSLVVFGQSWWPFRKIDWKKYVVHQNVVADRFSLVRRRSRNRTWAARQTLAIKSSSARVQYFSLFLKYYSMSSLGQIKYRNTTGILTLSWESSEKAHLLSFFWALTNQRPQH